MSTPSPRRSSTNGAYQLEVAIFGGFAPFIATFLVQVTGKGALPNLCHHRGARHPGVPVADARDRLCPAALNLSAAATQIT